LKEKVVKVYGGWEVDGQGRGLKGQGQMEWKEQVNGGCNKWWRMQAKDIEGSDTNCRLEPMVEDGTTIMDNSGSRSGQVILCSTK
jgi:hypothetical protein